MSKPSADGRCLCGAVTLNAASRDPHVGACHCDMCRRWGGGPLMAVDCGTDVTLHGEATVGVFDSSAWAERGFCTACGTHLFYRLKGSGQYIVPVGLFPDADDLVFDHQVFIDEKPGYYAFANDTREMTAAEVFEMFKPQQ